MYQEYLVGEKNVIFAMWMVIHIKNCIYWLFTTLVTICSFFYPPLSPLSILVSVGDFIRLLYNFKKVKNMENKANKLEDKKSKCKKVGNVGQVIATL